MHGPINIRYITPFILNFGTRWRTMVNSTLRPPYSREVTKVPIEEEASRAPDTHPVSDTRHRMRWTR